MNLQRNSVKMSLIVKKIISEDQLKEAFKIREEVFVGELNVPAQDENDSYESSSVHFLAELSGKPIGTARWRFTEDGIKLERFAVLQEYRIQGVGQALVSAVLSDIKASADSAGKLIYLHAQLPAISLYAKFGFLKVGDIFEECGIMHYQMEMT